MMKKLKLSTFLIAGAASAAIAAAPIAAAGTPFVLEPGGGCYQGQCGSGGADGGPGGGPGGSGCVPTAEGVVCGSGGMNAGPGGIPGGSGCIPGIGCGSGHA